MASIITLMQERGCPTDENGVCLGLALMAERARRLGEYDKFEYRMNFLETLEEGELNNLIEKAKEKSTAAYKKKYPNEILSEEEQQKDELLLSIDPFFEQIWAHYQPSAIQEFLEITEKARFSQAKTSDVEKLMYGDTKEILKESDKFTLATTEENAYSDLKKFLMATKDSNVSAGLVICSSNHAIHLFYDPQTQEWCLTNHSTLDRYPSTDIEDTLAAVASAFSENSILNLSIEMYTNDDSSEKKKLTQDLRKISEESLDSLITSNDINRADDSNATLLLVAAKNGDISTVKRLLENKEVNIDQVSSDCTALYVAAQNGHASIVDALLEKKANIAYQRKDHSTALFIAAQNGHFSIVDRLLSYPEVNVNQTMNDGITPLIIAAKNGHVTTVDRLLNQRDINIRQIAKNGMTVFHAAVHSGHVGMVDRFLNHPEINVSQAMNDGVTPLIIAVNNGYLDIIERLLNHPDVDVNQAMNDGATPLMIAAQQGRVTIVDRLLSHSEINVTKTAQNGATVLHTAVISGNIEIVDRFLNCPGVLVDAAMENGVTALHIAIQNKCSDITDRLLNHPDVNVNASMSDGTTPLHLAAQLGNVDAVKRLLAHREININQAADNGFTAFHLAFLQGHQEIIACLLRDPAFEKTQITTFVHIFTENASLFDEAQVTKFLSLSTENGLTELTMLLLDSIDEPSRSIEVLKMAIDGGQLEIIKALLNREEIKENPQVLNAIFHRAVDHHQLTIIEYLINVKEIDINGLISDGHAALHLAIQQNDTKVLDFLLEQKAMNVNQPDEQGFTALYHAIFLGETDKVNRLLKHKDINVNAISGDKKSALQLILEGHEQRSSAKNAQMAYALLEHPHINLPEAIQLLENNNNGLQEADRLILKAHAHSKAGEQDKALEIYKNLLDNEPRESVLWLSMEAIIRKKAKLISNSADEASHFKKPRHDPAFSGSTHRYFKTAANDATYAEQTDKKAPKHTSSIVRKSPGGK